ncbi:MAG: HD domain-containing protein [Lachnospiraceae bacterium]|nr:HD domain-containing protein [Lachnospiraceae bacterium]
MKFNFFSRKSREVSAVEAVDKIQLDRSKIELQRQIIASMAELIETRGDGRGLHVKRTSGFVWILASAAKDAGYHKDELNDETIAQMVLCSVLHDVGKIMIPDAILNKPGKLTEEEFVIMKKHAVIGGKLAREIMGSQQESYQNMAEEIATYHHEMWNGHGYPTGASGEDIPLSARIMAIVDVFDALVSPRVYKKAMDPQAALSIILADAGTHFDPTLAQLFYQKKKDILALIEDVQ